MNLSQYSRRTNVRTTPTSRSAKLNPQRSIALRSSWRMQPGQLLRPARSTAAARQRRLAQAQHLDRRHAAQRNGKTRPRSATPTTATATTTTRSSTSTTSAAATTSTSGNPIAPRSVRRCSLGNCYAKHDRRAAARHRRPRATPSSAAASRGTTTTPPSKVNDLYHRPSMLMMHKRLPLTASFSSSKLQASPPLSLPLPLPPNSLHPRPLAAADPQHDISAATR